MNDRQWKQYDFCPVSFRYGRSRNWGIFHESPRIDIFLRNCAPGNLYSTIEHEMIHYCIWKLGERMTLREEESAIYHAQCAGDDWI